MKLNLANPATGCQKLLDIEDDKKLRSFYDKRMSNEVEGDALGDEYKGYIFRISGGNDLQGFPMKQGVLKAGRVRLLLKEGSSCYRKRKAGECKRKSVRGCVVGPDLSVLNLVIVKKGEADIPGLTTDVLPRRKGPKTANNIRKLFGLEKKDDVKQFVPRRTIEREGKKTYTKAAKIQRLITPRRLAHKREMQAVKRQRYEATAAAAKEFNALLGQRQKEAKQAKEDQKRRKSSVRKASEKKSK